MNISLLNKYNCFNYLNKFDFVDTVDLFDVIDAHEFKKVPPGTTNHSAGTNRTDSMHTAINVQSWLWPFYSGKCYGAK